MMAQEISTSEQYKEVTLQLAAMRTLLSLKILCTTQLLPLRFLRELTALLAPLSGNSLPLHPSTGLIQSLSSKSISSIVLCSSWTSMTLIGLLLTPQSITGQPGHCMQPLGPEASTQALLDSLQAILDLFQVVKSNYLINSSGIQIVPPLFLDHIRTSIGILEGISLDSKITIPCMESILATGPVPQVRSTLMNLCRFIRSLEPILPSGTVSSSDTKASTGQIQPMEVALVSSTQSSPKSTSLSVECAGQREPTQTSCQDTNSTKHLLHESRHWCVTTVGPACTRNLRLQELVKSFRDRLTYTIASQSCSHSQGKCSYMNGQVHHHWYILLNHQITKTRMQRVFWMANSWTEPLKTLNPNHTLQEAQSYYLRYIYSKGSDSLSWGSLPQPSIRLEAKEQSKTSKVLYMIKSGMRLSQIIQTPGLEAMQVPGSKLMRYRPHRKETTKVLYIYGPPGVGKTYFIMQWLRSLHYYNPELATYCKVMGLSKWYDGYDNEPIVLIDDPVIMSSSPTFMEQVQTLRNMISTGPAYCEIKGSTWVFDSHVIVIVCNKSPAQLSHDCGSDNQDAMFRRFTDTRQPVFLKERGDMWRLDQALHQLMEAEFNEKYTTYFDCSQSLNSHVGLIFQKIVF